MSDVEIQGKLKRLSEFLDRHKLDGVMLWHRNNFAWITGGCDNHIVNSSPVGVGCILATKDGKRVCFANTIEAPRFQNEELTGRGIDVVDFPWYDQSAGRKVFKELMGGKKFATDADELAVGLPPLPADFVELRWSLSEPEIARYRQGGKQAAAGLEQAAREVKPGMTEQEIAGIIDHYVCAAGNNPVVTLVSADARLPKFRHPIPTRLKITKHVMLVSCSDFGGLISNLTRFIHFGPVSDELKRKQQAICNIDTAVNLATRPGRTLGEVFADLQAAYAKENWADQWKFHHQGGSTGYAGREVIATPGNTVKVVDNQAFAWNPSIVGAKSEDTVLVTGKGHEVLTPPSASWPKVMGTCKAGQLERADILVI